MESKTWYSELIFLSLRYNEIPDPYYGGPKGFNLVLDLLEDGCRGIINSLIKQYNL